MSKSQAKLWQRHWLDWARENLPSSKPYTDTEAASFVGALQELKKKSGPARSFEHESVSFESLVTTLLFALQRLGIERFAAIVGDPAAPAIFKLAITDLVALLSEVGQRNGTLVLALESQAGVLVVDPPDPTQGPGEVLVSGDRALAPLIDDFVARHPGGAEFAGN
jgi:hypothetical protein